jgi:hypothetical protein
MSRRVFQVGRPIHRRVVNILCCVLVGGALEAAAPGGKVDFNRDVRRILSENCFSCHGPDSKPRKSGAAVLRLDQAESALAEHGGIRPLVPGKPEQSEVIRRITTTDADDHMPPADSGKQLTAEEIALLKRWVAEGAPYAQHWAYVKPVRPAVPTVVTPGWVRNPVDAFIGARLDKEGLKPEPEADRQVLVRRVALDLTGLPPTLGEVDEFLADQAPGAYERMVERYLKKEAFGEHWARLWLDLARYADSSGYADDPARTIWGYRDYVIRSLNANKPFDQFTLEQLAGDLLPEPGDEELVATAFHRNTQTNNEGGTNDEEYRNVAVVDRVNTTMAVWMGTTMACAQCHNHKYDPISQEDYFRLFAVFNSTADADRTDESPVHALYTPEQKLRLKQWKSGIARLETILQTVTPALEQEQAAWEKRLAAELTWQPAGLDSVQSAAGAAVQPDADGSVRVARGGKTDTYTLATTAKAAQTVTAVRLEVLPETTPPARGVGHADGNFVVTRVRAKVRPPANSVPMGRFVRVELPGKGKILSLAEVQVFQGSTNLALSAAATQSTTYGEGEAKRAVDGVTDGHFEKAKSTTHTEVSKDDPWWEADLGTDQAVNRIVLWNRTDGAAERLTGFRLVLLDAQRKVVWEQAAITKTPSPSAEYRPDGERDVRLVAAMADYAEPGLNAGLVLENPDPKTKGWAIGPRFGEPHALTLFPETPLSLPAGGQLVLTVEQGSQFEFATIGRLRLSQSSDPRAADFVPVPSAVLALARTEPGKRTEAEQAELRKYYLSVAPSLQAERGQLARLKKNVGETKPVTTVPVLRELANDQRRRTHIQRRGNYLDRDREVTEGLPGAFPAPAADVPVDRLTLAQWLMDANNPLTARVVVNRLWESVFGIGIVRTSEEFGSQGEPPSHPELLDWLAVELREHAWDLNHVIRLLVNSAAYRQSSRVTPELAAQDPDNRLLARGPRFRLSAEMIRDQALFVAGLLSPKLYGPPVRPPQPKSGLSAAFGSGTDWETSGGEDRYRRALYTTWRRSNPYPSMATFDAPNREVCLVRRERSNTPLQALVTLNDPVYLEAAQALGRRMAAAGATPAEKLRQGYRLCLSRLPTEVEAERMTNFFTQARERFQRDTAKAKEMATQPLGALPEGADPAEFAAWTLVGNVLLNLDEVLMKR